jgi:hypothetical protein
MGCYRITKYHMQSVSLVTAFFQSNTFLKNTLKIRHKSSDRSIEKNSTNINGDKKPRLHTIFI